MTLALGYLIGVLIVFLISSDKSWEAWERMIVNLMYIFMFLFALLMIIASVLFYNL